MNVRLKTRCGCYKHISIPHLIDTIKVPLVNGRQYHASDLDPNGVVEIRTFKKIGNTLFGTQVYEEQK